MNSLSASVSTLGIAGLAWVLLTAGCAGPPRSTGFEFRSDPLAGTLEILDGPRSVLTYQQGTKTPGAVLDQVSPDNRKYAVARGDYLHPLRGPDGEELTRDWSVDHPHHRGIYWAWPEVDWQGHRGDLHALQEVFARPSGAVRTSQNRDQATIGAEAVWLWHDEQPIVHEQVTIRTRHETPEGRVVDLEFRFAAVAEPVSVARRGTAHYGGLNLRFAAIRGQQIHTHNDPPAGETRAAWGQISGLFPGGSAPATVLILQHPENPEYPGDWVQYPELNWLQPTFPGAGHRYELRRDRPLTLRFRLWIRRGEPVTDDVAKQLWDQYRREPLPSP